MAEEYYTLPEAPVYNALEFVMHQQLRQQPLIIFPIPYRIHGVIPQMQG